VKKFRNIPGVGLQGDVDICGGTFVHVVAGNSKVLDVANACMEDRAKFETFCKSHQDDTNVAVMVNSSLSLMIALNDTIRADAASAIQRLRGLGCDVTMLTGDVVNAARPVAETLGIDNVKASLLPEDKYLWVAEEEKRKMPTVMLGDGINDSKALAAATVGVAMGETSMALAARTADVVIMSDKLTLLPKTIKMCCFASRLVWLNIIFSAGVKMGAVVLALAGKLQLWMAIVVDVGSLLIVVLIGITVLARNGMWQDDE